MRTHTGDARRSFLFGASAAAVGLALQDGAAHAQTPPIYAGVFVNVRDYGAVAQPNVDDGPAFRAAIARAKSNGGGVVLVPPGIYRINTQVVIDAVVALEGVGTHPGAVTAIGQGSVINFGSINPIRVTGRGASVRNLAFFADQPLSGPGWSPNPTINFAISVECDDVLVQDIVLYAVTNGISVMKPGGGGSVGRVVLDRIFGQPIATGILIDTARDSVTVSNVHFWPYWTVDSNIIGWQSGNGVGILSQGNDNPFFDNIFCLNYSRGIQFGASSVSQMGPTVTSKFHLSNADFDYCGTGIYIDGSGVTGQASNISIQGASGKPQGIWIGNDVRFQCTNLHVRDYAGNGVRVQGTNSWATFENVWIANWNTSHQLFPGIEVASASAKVWLGNGRWFENGSGAGSYGGAGQVFV
jgi:hypothetical protein